MTTSIRPLATTEAAAFQTLRLAALQEIPHAFSSSFEEERAYNLESFAQRIAPSAAACVFGAFADDQLAGVLGVRREQGRKLAHKAFVWGMYVAPHFRQRGVGRQLVDAALDFARHTLQVRQVTLGVSATNLGAIRLYERAGFAPWGVEPGALQIDGVLHDEMAMVKVL